MTVALTPEEIVDITHKVQPAAQLRHLRRMGVRAERRKDGTVCVLRAWLANVNAPAPESKPRLKSDRGQTAQA
jgi:hypothetical protein